MDTIRKQPVFVEICDDPIIPARPYTDKKTNTQKLLDAKQKAYLWAGGRFPIEFEFSLEGNRAPLRPGRYLLAGDCFKLGGTQAGYTAVQFNSRGLDLLPLDDALAALKGPAVKAAA
jgi:hypothetical protein